MAVKVGLKYIEIWKDCLENAVQEYEKESVEKGQILFYGPSHFTRWAPKYGMKPLRECLLGASGAPCAVNRGFGSSSAEHQLYYYSRMVRPYEPKVLVYTSHGNNASFGYSDEEAWELAQRVIAWARTDFPGIEIVLVGAYPSRDMTPENEAEKRRYNAMVKAFADSTPNCRFIDVLDHEPFRRKDVYVEDGVHFNQTGYDLCAEFYKEALKEELSRY
jgi:hypothetical protein